MLAIARLDGQIQYVANNTNMLVQRYTWANDRTLFFTSAEDNALYLWKPFEPNLVPERVIDLGPANATPDWSPRSLAVSATGRHVAVVTPVGVELIEVATPGKPKRSLVPRTNSTVTTVAFSPGNRFLYFRSPDQPIRRVDLTHPQLPAADVLTAGKVRGFALSNDGRLLITATERAFEWYDATRDPPVPLGSYTTAVSPSHWQLAPDGRHLLVVEHGVAYVLRLATRSP